MGNNNYLYQKMKKLETSLSDDQRKEYFAYLKQWFSLKSPLTKEEFDRSVRKILLTDEQMHCHNYFLCAILRKKREYEGPNFNDYMPVPSSDQAIQMENKMRHAATELFMPDASFMACRIEVAAWANGFQGAGKGVAELMVYATQAFARNIITAMISRKKGYKIRNGKFQYGFNLPNPDPFTRNFNNAHDETMESKMIVEDDCLVPKPKPSLEQMEQEVAFMSASQKRKTCDNTLSVKLLYQVIRNNPKLLGLHGIHSKALLKLGLQVNDEDAEIENAGAEDG